MILRSFAPSCGIRGSKARTGMAAPAHGPLVIENWLLVIRCSTEYGTPQPDRRRGQSPKAGTVPLHGRGVPWRPGVCFPGRGGCIVASYNNTYHALALPCG